jgi:phospholipid transport system substrate-binding protein
MPFSRRLLLALPLVAFAASGAAAEPGAAPAALIERFYGVLLAVMKQAKQLSFDDRYARLAPAVTQIFDLPAMTRIAVGPDWAQLTAAQHRQLDDAFARYTISEYAARFDGYDGERFDVTPTATPNPNGIVVASRIVKSNGEAVSLNYLMRSDGAGAWKVIDVYLDGTISQLAARRSEFVAVLQRNGADGLVQLIERRTAALRPG